MQEYRLGLYEKAMPKNLSFAEKLELTGRAGFDQMELSIDETDEKLSRLDWGCERRRELRRVIEATGIPIYTLCLSGQRKYSMGARDACVRARSMEILEKAIHLAAELGIRIIQLAGYDVYYEKSDAETEAMFETNLAFAARMAAVDGVLLGFETMETPFMDTVTKAMKQVDYICSPFLGVYPDVGNLANAAALYRQSIVSDIEKGRGHILAAHLKETKPGVYRDMMFGDGHTPYAVAIDELLDQDVRIFTGEFWYSGSEDYAAELAYAAQFLRNRLDAGVERWRLLHAVADC